MLSSVNREAEIVCLGKKAGGILVQQNCINTRGGKEGNLDTVEVKGS